MQLKPIIEKLEALGSSDILIKFRNLGSLMLVFMVIFVFISWLPELTPGFIYDFLNKGQGGIVIVDSPEVYSRERLINDRFRQASWLEKELDESPDMSFGNQAISDLHQILGQDTKIGISNSAPEDGSAPKIAEESDTGPGKMSSPGTSVSPSERFRDIRAYREEIRTEMMETLLDDRHDIKGNTLYRLKFDTTVLPEDKTEKLAVIQVKLARAQFCDSNDSGSDSRHIPCISIKAIYHSWLKQTENKINLAINGTIKSFRRGSLSTSDFAELVRYLQVQVSGLNETEKWKSNNSFVSKQISNINTWNRIQKFNPACVGKIRQEYSRKTYESAAAHRKARDLKIKSCPLVPVVHFFPGKAHPENVARYGKLRNLLLYYYYDKLAYKSAHWEYIEIHEEFLGEKFDTFREDLESGNPFQRISIELRVEKIRADAKSIIAKDEKLIVDAKKRISDDEKLIADDDSVKRIVDAVKRIADDEKRITNADSVKRITDAVKKIADDDKLISDADSVKRIADTDTEKLIADAKKQINEADTEKRIADARKRIADDDDGKQIVFAEKRIDNAKKRISDAEKLVANTDNLIARAELAEQNLLRYAVVGMWIDKYTYKNEDRVEKCKGLYDDQLEVFDPKSMSCIAHLEKTTCNGVGFCTVRVELQIPEPRKGVISGQKVIPRQEVIPGHEVKCPYTDEEGDKEDWCNVKDTFERLLNIDEAYYSYAVTPKESAQRVLTIASEQRQKQLALSLLASSADGLDPATVTSITRAFSESATQIEQIQRKPLILSFGRGQPVETGSDPKVKQGIDFGWVIGPKFVFADKSDGDIKFYHAPAHNSLSAVISVPSWWTTIGLEIDTCWIDQANLPDLEKIKVRGLEKTMARGLWGETELRARNYVLDLCDTGSAGGEHDVDIDYLVRLPGSAEELPRKFGYEIERVPAISEGGVLAEFYVGQKNASLIIQGQELWRSTVVTLGHQKADNIEVLPNMKGIIATFETIDSPSQKIEFVPSNGHVPPSNCHVRSEVVVWTSEGRTVENQLFARIHANPLLARNSKADEAVVFPEGFGGCSYPPPNQKPAKPQEMQADSTNKPSVKTGTETER